jgi:tetratricopeptide (TPR) repeat protein
MRRPALALSATRSVPAFVALLLLAPACATQPKLGMEAPGRPVVTWRNDAGGSAAPPKVDADKKTERELLAELSDAERKGSSDLALASTLYNLAILRRQQGKFAEAEALYRRALEIREREDGPNHPDVAVVLNNLAGLKAAQGNYDAARPLLERALKIRQTALGTHDMRTAESMSNLALLYAAQGNAAAAEPLYQQALAILDKPDESQRGDLDRVLDNYAALLHDTGRDVEADKLEARARAIRAARQPQAGSSP